MKRIITLLLTIISFASYGQKVGMVNQGSSAQGIKWGNYQYFSGGLVLPRYATPPTKYSIDPNNINDTIRPSIYIDSLTGSIMSLKADGTWSSLANFDSLNAGFYSRQQTDSLITFILNSSYNYTDSSLSSVVSGFKGSIAIADSPTVDGIYTFSETGIYPNFGNVNVNLATGFVYGTKVGSTYQATTIPLTLTDYVTKKELGIPYTILDATISDNVTNPTLASGSRTVILNRVIASGEKVNHIKLWSTTAGNLIIGGYTITGGSAVRTKSVTIPILLGENDINLALYNFTLVAGEYFGYGYNTTTASGRVGTLVTTAPYSHFLFTTNVTTTPIATGAALTTSRLGVQIELVTANSVKQDIALVQHNLDSTNLYVRGDGNMLDPVHSNTSNMIFPNLWTPTTGTPVISFSGGVMTFVATSGNQNVLANSILTSGKVYTIQIRARVISGTVNKLTVGAGAFAAAASPSQYTATLSGTFQDFEFPLTTGAGTYLSMGVLTANNTGGTIEIDYIRVLDDSLSLTRKIDNQIATFGDQIDATNDYLTGDGEVLSDSTWSMGSGNSWVTAFGSPSFSFSGGLLTFTATASSQAIRVNGQLTIGKTYYIEYRARKASGSTTKTTIGGFATTGSAAQFTPELTDSFAVYKFQITATSADFYFGVLSGNNLGGVIEVDYIKVFDADRSLSVKMNNTAPTYLPVHFNLDGIFSSLGRNEKPLTVFKVVGNSLMANALGGVDTTGGVTKTPMRLGYKTVSRLVYDLYSWNKPSWRRLDDAAWTKSGTWTTINNNTIFEPVYDVETYHESVASGAYVEITVPSGQENFALICQTFTALGKVNVTLNGGSIAAYGATQINLSGGGETGNPYNIVQYLNLPAGTNTIRFTKEANTDKVRIWGGFYWSGNTLVVMNVAHGGHTMAELINEHLPQELTKNSFDAALLEVTLLNELGTSPTTSEAASKTNLSNILTYYLDGKDKLIITPIAWGKNVTDTTINYATLYPGLYDRNLACKGIAYMRGAPVLDLETTFKRRLENRGYTIESGQSGIIWKTDGQHENIFGETEQKKIIETILKTASFYVTP